MKGMGLAVTQDSSCCNIAISQVIRWKAVFRITCAIAVIARYGSRWKSGTSMV